MHWLFVLSYVLLSVLILLQAVLIREVMREVVWFKRFDMQFNTSSGWKGLLVGADSPEFSIAPMSGERNVTNADLKGQSTTLLFVSPSDRDSQPYSTLPVVLHALWHRASGHLYLVCAGDRATCGLLIKEKSLWGLEDNRVLLDENAAVARLFGIVRTPQAVELDELAHVARYGRPEQFEAGLEEKRLLINVP